MVADFSCLLSLGKTEAIQVPHPPVTARGRERARARLGAGVDADDELGVVPDDVGVVEEADGAAAAVRLGRLPVHVADAHRLGAL